MKQVMKDIAFYAWCLIYGLFKSFVILFTLSFGSACLFGSYFYYEYIRLDNPVVGDDLKYIGILIFGIISITICVVQIMSLKEDDVNEEYDKSA